MRLGFKRNVIVVLAGIVSIVLVAFVLVSELHYRLEPLPLTFIFFFIGVPAFWYFIIFKKKFIGEIDKMPKDEVKFYYEQILETFRATFIGLAFLLGILWGFACYGKATFYYLKFQTIVILGLWVYIFASSYYTIVLKLKDRMHKNLKEEEKKNQSKKKQ